MRHEQIESVFAHLRQVLGLLPDEELDEVIFRAPAKSEIEYEDDAEGARRFYTEH